MAGVILVGLRVKMTSMVFGKNFFILKILFCFLIILELINIKHNKGNSSSSRFGRVINFQNQFGEITFSLQMKNHYEVLNLEKNCSSKDIKDSFIKLSKKYHPDKNKSANAHEKFVEVNEAYSVLGKSCSRIRYDEILSRPPMQSRVVYQKGTGQGMRNHDFYYANAYAHNFKQNYKRSGSWNTSSNYKTVLYCCLLMAIGTGIRVLIVCKEIKKKEACSREISLRLKEVKEQSHQLGREEAIQRMKKKLGNKVGYNGQPDK